MNQSINHILQAHQQHLNVQNRRNRSEKGQSSPLDLKHNFTKNHNYSVKPCLKQTIQQNRELLFKPQITFQKFKIFEEK